MNDTESSREYNFRKKYYRSRYYEDPTLPFSMHNGWSTEESQISTYRDYAGLFNRYGTVLDLGCGNGLLLKCLVLTCEYNLVPYGVDFLDEAISEAKSIVLPEFAINFCLDNVEEFCLKEYCFTYVITSPFYVVSAHRNQYISRCYDMVEKGGRLLLYCYTGSEYFSIFAAMAQEWAIEKPRVFASTHIVVVYFDK